MPRHRGAAIIHLYKALPLPAQMFRMGAEKVRLRDNRDTNRRQTGPQPNAVSPGQGTFDLGDVALFTGRMRHLFPPDIRLVLSINRADPASGNT